MENERQRIGRIGEMWARLYLKFHGYTILAQNFRTRAGELDLIAKENDCIVFVEVKTRTNQAYGTPAEEVSYHKQRHMIRSAEYYLMKIDTETACRFDVIEVMFSGKGRFSFPKIRHLQNVIQ